jgi:hypothetical protein
MLISKFMDGLVASLRGRRGKTALWNFFDMCAFHLCQDFFIFLSSDTFSTHVPKRGISPKTTGSGVQRSQDPDM